MQMTVEAFPVWYCLILINDKYVTGMNALAGAVRYNFNGLFVVANVYERDLILCVCVLQLSNTRWCLSLMRSSLMDSLLCG